MSLEKLDATQGRPDIRGITPYRYTLDGGGRHAVQKLIDELDAKLLLEVGVYLGGSCYDWLEHSDALHVIGIDTWSDTYNARQDLTRYREINSSCFRYIDDIDGFIESTATHGFYASALANLSVFGDRFHPYRGSAPNVLYELRDLGVEPDIVYIDSAKNRANLDAAYECFPKAKLCGDDWEWGASLGFPMQQAVNGFAEENGFTARASGATWILDKIS
ncbi:MAG: hypothetical protein Hens2KO_20400 [Henriciella sp.]